MARAKRIMTSGAAVVALLLFLVPAAVATEDEGARSVTVSAEASVHVPPDRAEVRLAVVTHADGAEAARAGNERAAAATLDAIREQGIEADDMRTTGLRLQPRYAYDDETRQRREVGFEAVRDVHIRVQDLDRLPMLVAAVVGAGANRLHSVQYDLADGAAARADALRQAAHAARDKAHVLANSLEAELGPVIAIHEQHYDFARPRTARLEAMADGVGDSAAWAPGEVEVSAAIEVRFALRGGDAAWPF